MFDLDYARLHIDLDIAEIIHCFKEYTKFATGKNPPSKKEFLLNFKEKLLDADFNGDMEALLRAGVEYDQKKASEWVINELIEKI